jgi:hypothetical protein
MFQKKLKGLKVFGGSTTGAAAVVSARTASWSSEALKALGTSVLVGQGHMHDVLASYSFLNKNCSLVLLKKLI